MFIAEEFVNQDTKIIQRELYNLRKDELVAVIRHFNHEVPPGLKKKEIKQIALVCFFGDYIFAGVSEQVEDDWWRDIQESEEGRLRRIAIESEEAKEIEELKVQQQIERRETEMFRLENVKLAGQWEETVDTYMEVPKAGEVEMPQMEEDGKERKERGCQEEGYNLLEQMLEESEEDCTKVKVENEERQAEKMQLNRLEEEQNLKMKTEETNKEPSKVEGTESKAQRKKEKEER